MKKVLILHPYEEYGTIKQHLLVTYRKHIPEIEYFSYNEKSPNYQQHKRYDERDFGLYDAVIMIATYERPTLFDNYISYLKPGLDHTKRVKRIYL